MHGCEDWTLKKAEHQRIDAFKLWYWRRLLRVPWGIKPVHSKGNQPRVFTGRTDAEAPVLWPPDAKSWLIGKDLDAGKDWGQEEKGVTQDEMIGWHHQLSGLGFEQTPEDSEGQGSLACCSSWDQIIRHHLATEQQQFLVFTFLFEPTTWPGKKRASSVGSVNKYMWNACYT